jgi:hypothetical protein
VVVCNIDMARVRQSGAQRQALAQALALATVQLQLRTSRDAVLPLPDTTTLATQHKSTLHNCAAPKKSNRSVIHQRINQSVMY